MPRPVLIGVTGGIGAGKSTVVDAFVHRGAVPFSADSAVHELYSDPGVVDAVRERWGDGVISATDGSVDRAAIAAIVFTDEAERRWLEGLLHPLVGRAWLRFVEAQRSAESPPEFAVAEVPLLFEAGLEDRYDAIVTITAPLPLRIERAEARDDGKRLSKERAASQMPEEEKAERADFTYVNTGSFDDLDAFAGRVLDALRPRVTAG
jgi:dephospho-CoA kinase